MFSFQDFVIKYTISNLVSSENFLKTLKFPIANIS